MKKVSEMNVWRLQTNTDSQSGLKIADYCIKNKILAMGWSLKDSHLQNKNLLSTITNERNNIKSFDDYSKLINKFGVYGGEVNSNVNRLYYYVKPNDLVWIRSEGIYYLGRITNDSHWYYTSCIGFRCLKSNNRCGMVQNR